VEAANGPDRRGGRILSIGVSPVMTPQRRGRHGVVLQWLKTAHVSFERRPVEATTNQHFAEAGN
jgi:hypothetical protein